MKAEIEPALFLNDKTDSFATHAACGVLPAPMASGPGDDFDEDFDDDFDEDFDDDFEDDQEDDQESEDEFGDEFDDEFDDEPPAKGGKTTPAK